MTEPITNGVCKYRAFRKQAPPNPTDEEYEEMFLNGE